MHAEQVEPNMNDPALQLAGEQALAPTAVYVPEVAGHVVQVEAPAAAAMVPAPQFPQADAPVKEVYIPATQLTH